MSFQLNTATALPSEVQLGKEKPQGAFCLRSRYALSANSASSWNAGTTLTLPLQTGTPGTFTDVKQGIIQCTLQITNTNPYVDFINFGPSGALIFFDEMRIYSSGTPVEENLRYSETADLLTIQGGHQCRPFHIYRRNKWRAANGLAGDKHINFIKPSMVDACGVPMYGRTPFMDKNSAVYHPPSISFGIFNVTTPYGADASPNLNNADSFGQLGGTDSTGVFYDAATSQTTVSDTNDADVDNDETTSTDFHRELEFRTGQFSGASIKNTMFASPAPSLAEVTQAKYLPAARYVPSQWPDYQPSTLCGEFDDEEVDTIMGKAKVSEYMKYLCNVRSLPIGVEGTPIANDSYSRNCNILAPVAPQSSTVPGCRYLQYRVSMPFLSGIYGILAEKMFPDMLIGANNIRIEFKLAQNAKALWTSMDPCRRVPGTLRDFTAFTGRKSGFDRASPVLTTGTVKVASVLPSNAALGCANAVVAFDTTTPQTLAARNFTEMYNSASAMGEDLVMSLHSGEANVDGSVQTLGLRKGTASNRSNLPKPQFVPVAAPWSSKESGVVTYVNERAGCFGTYLPASQAQSRRCWINTKLDATSDSFANAGQTSFSIRDIQYIGEQVQLDDVVTSAIIQSAASSEIVVWTRGYRSFEANCDQNIQQNIILPIQIGQAEALYLIFRPATILTSPDYYSNSFSCPFVGLSYDTLQVPNEPAGTKYDVGGTYRLQSSLDSAAMGAFSYQLFSGTKQYPLQPIQTVTELLTEREKSQHNLHNWNMCSTENMSILNWGSKFGASTTANGLDFDPFMDFGYFTTFVSVFALDDQTITQNPYLQVAEYIDGDAGNGINGAGAGTRIRGRRAPASFVSAAGGLAWEGVLNEFLSPVGSFYLGWDFESWTNHQDVMRTGKFLGQEQLTVRMTGTHLCTATNILSVGQVAQAQNIQCTAIVPHVVKMSFVPGGHMLTYY
jgi:hypothetical protein